MTSTYIIKKAGFHCDRRTASHLRLRVLTRANIAPDGGSPFSVGFAYGKGLSSLEDPDMGRVSIAFVDEQPFFLAGLSSIFAADEGFQVVATGSSAGEAIEIARTLRPNLLIMELKLPGDAFAAISEIAAEASFTKIIVLTASSGVDTAIRALEAGACGYLSKASPPEELSTAAETVLRGRSFISQSLAAEVLVALQTATLRTTTPQPVRLSVREEQIVHLLLRGLTNRAIAESLSISEKTVKHYMTILMQKMHVRNRLEVVIAAQKLDDTRPVHGFGQPPS